MYNLAYSKEEVLSLGKRVDRFYKAFDTVGDSISNQIMFEKYKSVFDLQFNVAFPNYNVSKSRYLKTYSFENDIA